jgi:hypothetical protein
MRCRRVAPLSTPRTSHQRFPAQHSPRGSLPCSATPGAWDSQRTLPAHVAFSRKCLVNERPLQTRFVTSRTFFFSCLPQEVPAVNAVIEGDEIIFRDFYDISIAVATPKVRR